MSTLDSTLGQSVVSGCSSLWVDTSVVKSQVGYMKSSLMNYLKESSKSNKIWTGSWVPEFMGNMKQRHNWLPNEQYGSSHFALCADVYIISENLTAEWVN